MEIEDVKRKVRAMLDRTTDRGCTEAEAAAAATTAARLMSDHGLSDDDLVMTVERVDATARPTPLDDLWVSLAMATGCVAVREVSDSRLAYYGKAPGPTIAAYLHVYLRRVAERLVDDFQDTPEYKRKAKGKPRRKACEAFRSGVALRLRTVLARRFGAPDHATLERAAAFRDAQCGRLRDAPPPKRWGGKHDAAREAGYRAGADVVLRDGLGGGHSGYLEGK